jgi:predicted negative regulator of RcsB-dependent stress response
VARITRKELKTDKFAEEVGLTVTFFEEHRQDVIKYGGIAIAVVVVVFGIVVFQRHQHTAREESLAAAIAIQESQISPTPIPHTFPTQISKDQAAIKAFSDIATKDPGTSEGYVAEYYLGSIIADQGKMAEAEKHFQIVAQKADDNYASLSKAALAEIYFADGRDQQGEQMLRDLIAHPTMFVSKDEASINLARHIGRKNAAEARKLLEPIRQGRGPIASRAQMVYADLQQQ